MEAIKDEAHALLETYHKAGLDTAQAKDLFEKALENQKAAMDAAAAARGDKIDYLKQEFGNAFDNRRSEGLAAMEELKGINQGRQKMGARYRTN